jgi:DNA-binding NarL/FixJ family response regulator
MRWTRDTTPLEPIRVLIVDDSAPYRAGLRAALAAEAALAVVGEADSGEAALALAASLRPDVVLMDVAMPGMNGLEATGRLKAHADAPCVIIVTLYDLPAYRVAAVAAGADGFLPKSDLTAHPGEEILRICRAWARGATRGTRA